MREDVTEDVGVTDGVLLGVRDLVAVILAVAEAVCDLDDVTVPVKEGVPVWLLVGVPEGVKLDVVEEVPLTLGVRVGVTLDVSVAVDELDADTLTE